MNWRTTAENIYFITFDCGDESAANAPTLTKVRELVSSTKFWNL